MDIEFILKRKKQALNMVILLLVAYIFAGPFIPNWKYELVDKRKLAQLDVEPEKIKEYLEKTDKIVAHLPVSPDEGSSNRVIIPKIGVNSPIIESLSEKDGLNKGAWRMPDSSTPSAGGNTVITGHRYKYLPPHNKTFYLFDKLVKNDLFTILWNGAEYHYKVREVKVVAKDDLSILEKSDKPIVTMFTCNPVYSTKERLVVIGELI